MKHYGSYIAHFSMQVPLHIHGKSIHENYMHGIILLVHKRMSIFEVSLQHSKVHRMFSTTQVCIHCTPVLLSLLVLMYEPTS